MNQSDTTSTTQQTSYPDWFNAAATANTLPHMQPQKNMIAGLNEDQLMAGNLARQGARNANSGPDYASAIMSAGGPVSGEDAMALANPFLQSVGRDTVNSMRSERDNSSAQIGARNANAVAFGGSGAALERAQLDRGYGENVGRTINSILGQGYDRGMQLAEGNANREMSAAVGANSAANDTQSRQRYALQDLLGYGNMAQGQAQKQLDIPWTAMQRYQSLQPGAQVSTQPDTSPGWLQQLLGVGLSLAGMPVDAGGSVGGNWLAGLGK